MYEDKRTIMPNGLLSQATRQSSVTPNRVEVGFINQNATKPDSGHVNIDKAKAEAERKQKEAQDSGGMSVICTRYFLMGYMPLAIYELDSKYGQLIKEYHPEFYDWYLSWAQKLANQLHIRAWHNHVLVDLLWPFVDHWSREMANMMDESKKGSKLGAAIMFIGEYAFIAHQRIKQMVEVIKHYFTGGIYCKEMLIPEDYQAVSHQHTYDHLSVLTKGCVIVEANNQQTTYYAPAIIEIKAMVTHSVTAINGAAHWLCIHATQCTDEDQVDEVLIEKVCL